MPKQKRQRTTPCNLYKDPDKCIQAPGCLWNDNDKHCHALTRVKKEDGRARLVVSNRSIFSPLMRQARLAMSDRGMLMRLARTSKPVVQMAFRVCDYAAQVPYGVYMLLWKVVSNPTGAGSLLTIIQTQRFANVSAFLAVYASGAKAAFAGLAAALGISAPILAVVIVAILLVMAVAIYKYPSLRKRIMDILPFRVPPELVQLLVFLGPIVVKVAGVSASAAGVAFSHPSGQKKMFETVKELANISGYKIPNDTRATRMVRTAARKFLKQTIEVVLDPLGNYSSVAVQLSTLMASFISETKTTVTALPTVDTLGFSLEGPLPKDLSEPTDIELRQLSLDLLTRIATTEGGVSAAISFVEEIVESEEPMSAVVARINKLSDQDLLATYERYFGARGAGAAVGKAEMRRRLIDLANTQGDIDIIITEDPMAEVVDDTPGEEIYLPKDYPTDDFGNVKGLIDYDFGK